jgi:hypothetical protein
VAEPGTDGEAHGLEPDWQICPTVELPFGTPFTSQNRAVSAVLFRVAVKDVRWPTWTIADEGDTVTLMLLNSITVADAVSKLLVAWITTVLGDGKSIGAAYSAVFALLGAMVPIVELPAAIPLTSHAMGAPVARQNEAVNACVCARETVTADGEIVFVAEHVMVTLAVADLVASATLVAVTLTIEGDGGTAGAT